MPCFISSYSVIVMCRRGNTEWTEPIQACGGKQASRLMADSPFTKLRRLITFHMLTSDPQVYDDGQHGYGDDHINHPQPSHCFGLVNPAHLRRGQVSQEGARCRSQQVVNAIAEQKCQHIGLRRYPGKRTHDRHAYGRLPLGGWNHEVQAQLGCKHSNNRMVGTVFAQQAGQSMYHRIQYFSPLQRNGNSRSNADQHAGHQYLLHAADKR